MQQMFGRTRHLPLLAEILIIFWREDITVAALGCEKACDIVPGLPAPLAAEKAFHDTEAERSGCSHECRCCCYCADGEFCAAVVSPLKLRASSTLPAFVTLVKPAASSNSLACPARLPERQ